MVAEIDKQNIQYWSLNVPTHEELAIVNKR